MFRAFILSGFAAIFVLLFPLAAQDITLWPEEVGALIELDEREFEIFNEGKSIYRVRQIIHFFSENETDYAIVHVDESPFRKCKKLSGKIFDRHGNVVKKTGKKDINKAEHTTGTALYSESKYQWIELSWPSYPYKIEYECEIEFKSLFFWPDWTPQEDIPVLNATYKLIIHDPEIRYQTHSIGKHIEPVYSREKGREEWFWQLQGLEPQTIEEDMPPENRLQAALLFAPHNFKLGDSRGSFESWNDMARWYRSLTAGRYELPPEAKMKVRELTKGAGTDFEKVQRLYTFLQNYTRYVAIHLDIGGWQPHTSASIFTNKYGDCKDLSTLMIAMLNEAGITAYPALTPTRYKGVLIKEFPSNQFNHCIAFVPLQDDTLWLECTADYLPAGELPPMTEGCDVLVVKENSGEILRTSLSRAQENRWESRVKARLTSNGTLMLSGSIHSYGNQARELRGGLIYFETHRKEDWLRNRVIGSNVPKMILTNYTAQNVEEHCHQPLLIRFEGSVTNFAPASARRLFVNPNILNQKSRGSVPDDEERTFPVFHDYAYVDVDSVEIELPLGYTIEGAPLPQDIKTDFGHYQTGYSLEGNMLKYRRMYRLDKNMIPPTQYNEYRNFIRQVSKNDNTSFVFKK
jgi:hypothetical protein